MEEKERYCVKKLAKDNLFPETLCELKDTESKFFMILESIVDANKIKDLLNQQDTRIKELEKENQKANIKNYLTDYYLVEKENQQLKQSQKQLAIEKLEQILNYMENSNNNHYPLPYEIKNFIDNQIKNLN